LVTSASAISQSNLFAARQQVFVVERTDDAPEAAATPETNTTINTAASANRHEDAAPSLAHQDGPSRARVQIRSLDLGLTPAEVVGTPDVLQRFDSNGDGRVDLLESDKATLVRQNLFTFAGVGNPAGEVEITAPVIVSRDDATTVPAATATEEAAPGEPKKFFVAATPDGRPAAHKFADAREAAAGGVTATVAVAKKFYGQGTEAVAGAAHGAPVRLYDKAAVLRQQAAAREDGGETRLYDKVAQSDVPNRQHSGSGATLHERARQIAAAINGAKKTVVVQVAAYSTAAAASTKQAALLVESTDLTA